MRKRILKQCALMAAASCIVANTYAVGPGLYMGIQGGPATNNSSTIQAQVQGAPTTTPITSKSTQFGSSIYMGYQINKYAAAEGGINYFSTINYNAHDVQTCSGTTARIRDFHLMGKGIIPIGNSFDVFGKAGVAIVYKTTSGALNPNLNNACGVTQYNNKFDPAFSVGASYALSQSWVTDLSWNTILVGSPINNVTMIALGISYHFVDTYCGQFLC